MAATINAELESTFEKKQSLCPSLTGLAVSVTTII